MDITETGLLRALALVVKDERWQIIVAIAALEDTIRQVDILAIHKEILVEESHLVERLAPQHAESSTHHLDGCRCVPVEITHIVMSEAMMCGHSFAESYHFPECHHRRRNSTTALSCRLATGIQHANTQGTGICMTIHPRQSLTQCGLCHDGVRIEQKHILAMTHADGEVIGSGKAQIMPARHYANPVEVLAQILHRTVDRMIVHQQHLGFDSLQRLMERKKTLLYIILYVIVDDYY